MKITTITKDNLTYFKSFLTDTDAEAIREDGRILPLGLVADDLPKGGNTAAGALCLCPEEYMLKITSFFVAPGYRGKGAGRFLLDEAKRLFGEEDMEFNIEFLLYGKEEEEFALFLEHYGFSYADPEYNVYAMTVRQMKETPIFGKEEKGIPFRDIPPAVYNQSQNIAIRRGALLPKEGFRSPGIDQDISIAITEDDHSIEAFVLFERIAPDKLLLSSLFSPYRTQAVIGMLAQSAKRIAKKYDDDTVILMQPLVDGGIRLLEKMNIEPRMISCRYRYLV